MARTGAALISVAAVIAGCAGQRPRSAEVEPVQASPEYEIGPGDSLQIFVWEHPEVSVTVPVRPDGRISTPLVQDMQAAGKTPTRLSRDLEQSLAEYIRSPQVNVIVTGFVGTFGTQIRVVGQAAQPQAIPYRQNMTLLDVMIEVGGLGEFAAGNRAKIVRRSGGVEEDIPVRIHDLINRGRTERNVEMRPGDILIIPESRF